MSQINALPAASRRRHEKFNPQPDFEARPRQGVTGLAEEMKIILLALLVALQGTALCGERHVVFDSPGHEASKWRWIPVTLSDAERELLSKRSDPPKTALDYYLLLSGRYFRNIAHESERRIAFIDREALSDNYLHAAYTIPSVDAGAFWITIRLFGTEDNPLVAICHRSGTKRLFAAKENGPLGLWSISLNRPEFWRYRGGAFSQGGAWVRGPDSILSEPSVEQILDRYRNHYKAHLNQSTQKKSIYLTYELPQEGNRLQVTGRENFMDPSKRYVWAEYTLKGATFAPSTNSEQGEDDQAADTLDSNP